MFNITDLALSKLKNFLKKNNENVVGFFCVYNAKDDELEVKKVYTGDKLLTREELTNIKNQILNNGKQ